MSLDKVVERVLQPAPRLVAVILDQLVQAVDHLLLLRQGEQGVLPSLPDLVVDHRGLVDDGQNIKKRAQNRMEEYDSSNNL